MFHQSSTLFFVSTLGVLTVADVAAGVIVVDGTAVAFSEIERRIVAQQREDMRALELCDFAPTCFPYPDEEYIADMGCPSSLLHILWRLPEPQASAEGPGARCTRRPLPSPAVEYG